jgi:superfamily II helicase
MADEKIADADALEDQTLDVVDGGIGNSLQQSARYNLGDEANVYCFDCAKVTTCTYVGSTSTGSKFVCKNCGRELMRLDLTHSGNGNLSNSPKF